MAVLRFTSLIKIRDPNPYILVTTAQAKSVKPNWRKPLPVERSSRRSCACRPSPPLSSSEIPAPRRSPARSRACLYRRAAACAVRRGHAARGRGLARGVFLALAQGVSDPERSRPVGGDASVAHDGFLLVPAGPDPLSRREPDRVRPCAVPGSSRVLDPHLGHRRDGAHAGHYARRFLSGAPGRTGGEGE